MECIVACHMNSDIITLSLFPILYLYSQIPYLWFQTTTTPAGLFPAEFTPHQTHQWPASRAMQQPLHMTILLSAFRPILRSNLLSHDLVNPLPTLARLRWGRHQGTVVPLRKSGAAEGVRHFWRLHYLISSRDHAGTPKGKLPVWVLVMVERARPNSWPPSKLPVATMPNYLRALTNKSP